MNGRRVSWPRNEPLTKRRVQSAAFVVGTPKPNFTCHLADRNNCPETVTFTWPTSRESAALRSMAPFWHFFGQMRKHLDRAAVSLIKLMSNLFMNYSNNWPNPQHLENPSGHRIRRIELTIVTQFARVIFLPFWRIQFNPASIQSRVIWKNFMKVHKKLSTQLRTYLKSITVKVKTVAKHLT
jgi:hypothetical protein